MLYRVEGPKESDGALSAVVYGIDSEVVEEVKTWRVIGAEKFEVEKAILEKAQAAGAKDVAARLDGRVDLARLALNGLRNCSVTPR